MTWSLPALSTSRLQPLGGLTELGPWGGPTGCRLSSSLLMGLSAPGAHCEAGGRCSQQWEWQAEGCWAVHKGLSPRELGSLEEGQYLCHACTNPMMGPDLWITEGRTPSTERLGELPKVTQQFPFWPNFLAVPHTFKSIHTVSVGGDWLPPTSSWCFSGWYPGSVYPTKGS